MWISKGNILGLSYGFRHSFSFIQRFINPKRLVLSLSFFWVLLYWRNACYDLWVLKSSSCIYPIHCPFFHYEKQVWHKYENHHLLSLITFWYSVFYLNSFFSISFIGIFLIMKVIGLLQANGKNRRYESQKIFYISSLPYILTLCTTKYESSHIISTVLGRTIT